MVKEVLVNLMDCYTTDDLIYRLRKCFRSIEQNENKDTLFGYRNVIKEMQNIRFNNKYGEEYKIFNRRSAIHLVLLKLKQDRDEPPVYIEEDIHESL